MAFLCVFLLLTAAEAQPQNPYYSVHDKDVTNVRVKHSEDSSNHLSPSLNALFFLQSPADHTHVLPPSVGKQNHQADPSSPDLPPGLSKLFPAFELTETPSGKNQQYSSDQAENENSVQKTVSSENSKISNQNDSTILEPQDMSQKSSQNNDAGHGLPGIFASSKVSNQPYRKIRRNRDRNHHRKVRQRHANLSVPTGGASLDSQTTFSAQPDSKTKTIAHQHLKFLSKSGSSMEEKTKSNSQKHRAKTDMFHKLQGGKKDSNITKNLKYNPKMRRNRKKRRATMPGHDAIPGETFYYRRPDEHTGTGVRPHREDPDSLVHSLELKEDKEQEEPHSSRDSPLESLPTERHPSTDVDNIEDPIKAPDVSNNDKSGEMVGEEHFMSKEESGGLHGASSENTTLNETLARQMFRSPMLVDYGSRVKPQDVIRPTETDLEEAVLAEELEADDLSPMWAETDMIEDDISLEAEDVVEEDPPNMSEAEPETDKDREEEVLESRIEVPIIPLQANINPMPESAAEENSPDPDAEAEPESEPEPEPEGSAQPTGEAEGEGEGEPEKEHGPTEENGPISVYAEPQPEWEDAKKIWGPWWEIHVYGFGLAFAVLSIYSFVSVLRLWRKKNLLSQGYFIALNTIMFLMGAFRALYFLVDGYNSNRSFNVAGHYFLYSIGFPCLTSAFSILLLALLQTLKMQILSPKIQKTRIVIGIIIGHFLLSITTDIIVGYLSSAKVMMFVCQVATVFWGLLLFVGYIYVFRKLYKAAKWRQNEMMRLSLAKFKLDGISPITKAPRLTLNMAVKITLATAIFGLILAGLQTYGLVDVASVFAKDTPNPWTWLLYNTGMRLTELAMCITMSYVATQPFRYQPEGKNEEQHHSSSCFSGLIYMAPCRRIFECDSVSLHDDDLSWNDLPITRESVQEDLDGPQITSDEATPMTANGRAAQAVVAAVVHNQNEREGSTGSKRSSKVAARPASLLVSDNGFIRFREDGEMGGSPVLLSTDDELENISGENMIRNPFYRDLLRRQEKERAVGRATFVNSDGITLQDEFGLVENFQDPELVPPPRPTYPIKAAFRGCSYPNTGTNTPGTPRSFCSTDLEYAASEISYRPPSSIHLRDSIENALNIPGFTLRTPDILDSPLNVARLRTRRGSLLGTRIGARPMGTGSMSDLESLRHYGPGSRYGESEDTMEVCHERAASPDSMYSYTLSNLTRAPLVRSYSDSIGKASQPEMSNPNSPEHHLYKSRLRANMLRNLPENANQFQNLLKNINEMCNVYNKLSPDDREGDE